ncbi:hypothetical protein FQR65_LT16467 [Abscondita terminalis]|nr:hypothetical protein FQR65_LT16467 [Abscondita terminalis]
MSTDGKIQDQEILLQKLEARIEVKEFKTNDNVPSKKMSNAPSPTKVFALGGLEEVGKNTYCFEYEDEIIMIDAGVKFPDSTQPGIQAVIPDYSYLVENKQKVKALFITHGHEDHIGGIPYLLQQVDIPVIYASELAAALIKDRIKEFKLKDKVIVRTYKEDDVYVTKHFKVSFATVNHSIPDAFGILLRHEANIAKMSQMGQEGIELLMSDSTNAEVEGYTLGERKVIQNIDAYFLKAKGRIIVASFASNVHRLQEIIELCSKYGRRIAIFGRSLERIIKIIRQLGTLNISDKYFIKSNEIGNYPNNQILMLSTGSQGEPMAALSRIARREHQTVEIIPGDTIIMSSSPIPGNRADVELVINRLSRLGANVIENSAENRIHTSGHASQEEQKLLFTLLKPHYFMPMHGEYRMLKMHGETAVSVNVKPHNVFVVANGDQVELHNGAGKLGKRVPADAIFVDGKNISGNTNNIIRERNVLAKDGLMAIIISIDSQNNKLLARPRILSRGSFVVKENTGLINEAINLVTESIQGVLHSQKPTFGAIKSVIKETLAPFIFRHKRRNPLIIPVILNKKNAGTTNIKEQYDRTPSLTAELFSSTFMTSFFAFCGIETFIMSANNVRDREKTMPKAITIIMILVTAFYIIFTLLMIGSIGQDFSDYKGNPIFELFGANKTFKDFGLAIIIICTILLRFNSTIQMTLFGGSSIEPLAQQKFIPSVFAKNDKDGLPIYGIIFTAVSFAIVIGLFIFVPDIIQGVTGNESPFGYGQLAGASSFYFLIIYGLAIVCVLINGGFIMFGFLFGMMMFFNIMAGLLMVGASAMFVYSIASPGSVDIVNQMGLSNDVLIILVIFMTFLGAYTLIGAFYLMGIMKGANEQEARYGYVVLGLGAGSIFLPFMLSRSMNAVQEDQSVKVRFYVGKALSTVTLFASALSLIYLIVLQTTAFSDIDMSAMMIANFAIIGVLTVISIGSTITFNKTKSEDADAEESGLSKGFGYFYAVMATIIIIVQMIFAILYVVQSIARFMDYYKDNVFLAILQMLNIMFAIMMAGMMLSVCISVIKALYSRDNVIHYKSYDNLINERKANY